MAKKEDAQKAIDALNGLKVRSLELIVQEAEIKKAK